MSDKFILGFEDILTGVIPLAAALLAVWKDTTKQDKLDPAKRKLTPYGAAALAMAAVGFTWSMYCTNENKIAANERREKRDEYFRGMEETLKKELPEYIAKALENSQHRINKAVDIAVANSKDGLQANLELAIRGSKTELSDTLSKAIAASQGDIKTHFVKVLDDSQKELNKNVATAIDASKIILKIRSSNLSR